MSYPLRYPPYQTPTNADHARGLKECGIHLDNAAKLLDYAMSAIVQAKAGTTEREVLDAISRLYSFTMDVRTKARNQAAERLRMSRVLR